MDVQTRRTCSNANKHSGVCSGGACHDARDGCKTSTQPSRSYGGSCNACRHRWHMGRRSDHIEQRRYRPDWRKAHTRAASGVCLCRHPHTGAPSIQLKTRYLRRPSPRLAQPHSGAHGTTSESKDRSTMMTKGSGATTVIRIQSHPDKNLRHTEFAPPTPSGTPSASPPRTPPRTPTISTENSHDGRRE